MAREVIEIKNLVIQHQTKKQTKNLVKGVDVTIFQGEILGIVGESGSGKSLTMKSILGILPKKVQASYDQMDFEGRPISRENHVPIAMIFQDPMSSLNPLRKIGYHLEEVVKRFHPGLTKEERKEKMLAMLEKVRIPNPQQRLNQYPFEFSGGMRQRILIAMALLATPKVLIADEPTTALDVTIQAQILALLKELQASLGLTVVVVSHDFSVIASLCDRVFVMRQGEFVEGGLVEEIFYHPEHVYTQELLQAASLKETAFSEATQEETSLVAVSETHFVRKESRRV